MSKRQWIIALGVAIALFQFYAGFPSSSLLGKITGAALGLLVAFIAYKLKPEQTSRPSKPMPFIDVKDHPDSAMNQPVPSSADIPPTT